MNVRKNGGRVHYYVPSKNSKFLCAQPALCGSTSLTDDAIDCFNCIYMLNKGITEGMHHMPGVKRYRACVYQNGIPGPAFDIMVGSADSAISIARMVTNAPKNARVAIQK